MNLNDCYEILNLNEKYYHMLYAFETKINTELYETLTNSFNINKFVVKLDSSSDFKQMEFYDLRNSFYGHKNLGTKYVCKYVFDKKEQNIGKINFTISLKNLSGNKQTNQITNEQINSFCPELYEQLKLFENTNILNTDEYKSLVDQKNKIILMKTCLKNYYVIVNNSIETINKCQLSTDLYRYYLKNLGKMIPDDFVFKQYGSKQFNQIKQFYDFFVSKYNMPNNDFELDYLEYYFLGEMGLKNDFEVKFDSEGYLYFANETYTLIFKQQRSRYVGSYQPKYTVKIKENNTNNIVKTIGLDDFDVDRNLERCYDNLLDFINETVKIVLTD